MATPKNCKLCKLGCGKAVPSHGPKKPKLIVISDSPGRQETEQGKNMVGKPGQLLRKALKNIVGVDPDSEVFFMNVLRCELGDNKVNDAMLAACRKWTQEDFKEVDCNLVLIAGSLAFESTLPNIFQEEKSKDKKFSIAHARGSVYHHLGKTYLVTWNPISVEANSFKAPNGNVLDILDGINSRTELFTCFTTGSTPSLFVKDLTKLKLLMEAQVSG